MHDSIALFGGAFAHRFRKQPPGCILRSQPTLHAHITQDFFCVLVCSVHKTQPPTPTHRQATAANHAAPRRHGAWRGLGGRAGSGATISSARAPPPFFFLRCATVSIARRMHLGLLCVSTCPPLEGPSHPYPLVGGCCMIVCRRLCFSLLLSAHAAMQSWGVRHTAGAQRSISSTRGLAAGKTLAKSDEYLIRLATSFQVHSSPVLISDMN